MEKENTAKTLEILNSTIKEMQIDIKKAKIVLNEHTEELDKINRLIAKIEGKNDFEKIVLSDFGSRLSILEEEGEKYNKY